MLLIWGLHWIVVLVPKTVKKEGITLPPFVSFPLLPTSWSTSLVAGLISMFFSHILWDHSLRPSPVRLTHVYVPQAFASALKSRARSVLQHKPAAYLVPKAAVTYLVCQPCLDFSVFRCVLDALPYSSGRDTASPPSSSSSSCAVSSRRGAGCFGLIQASLEGLQTLQSWHSQLGSFAPSHQCCPESR